LTYKEGFANTVRKEAEKDVAHIQTQYQGIIEILKQKIKETDEVIRVKKAAKGEFSYALNKNLLKTISNLSLEVMSLNQMSLRDGEWSEEPTQKFMQEVDAVIKEKLLKVREYRQGLIDEPLVDDVLGDKKKKHITFA
jgi:hypothetical protein